MNRENQNIEWKESWRDEYLKWICGFANAQGGKIYIGKADNGAIVDLKDAAKLLEDIPNKTRDVLGILVNVNLLTENDQKYLEIEVDAYPSPVSYKGQYHYRSGSTKQELKGAALDKFLLQKQGKRWDGVPVPHVTAKDFDKTAFQYFRKNAIKSKRLDSDILKDSNQELLKKLHLTEGNYLKRAAILLFHPDPEVYVTGALRMLKLVISEMKPI
jgi:ATP-dependent DNA helicase RecG